MMMIERVSLIPLIEGDRLSSVEAKNEINKLGNIKDEASTIGDTKRPY